MKTAKKVQKLSSSEESGTMPSSDPVASGSGIAMSGVVPEETTAEEPPRLKSPLPFHDKGMEEAPAEMPDLETEQEATAAREKSQPTPEAWGEEVSAQQEEVSAQQEREVLEQLYEIWRLANLAQVTARQNDQTFMVALEENVAVDWRLYEEAFVRGKSH